MSSKSTARARLFDIEVDRLTMEQSVRRADQLISSGESHQHVVVNAAKIVAASKDEKLRTILNGCSMVNADGMAVVWASRLLGDPLPERVAGIDFMDELVALAAVKGYRIFLLGAEQEVLERVRAAVESRGAIVAGHHHGFWRRSQEDSEIATLIRSAQADILFTALPSPFKEEFLSAHLSAMNVKLCVGVGGSFDVVAGKTKRAPVLLQSLGLEWLYRLLQEPRRMFKRYLFGNLAFIRLSLIETVKKARRRSVE